MGAVTAAVAQAHEAGTPRRLTRSEIFVSPTRTLNGERRQPSSTGQGSEPRNMPQIFWAQFWAH